ECKAIIAATKPPPAPEPPPTPEPAKPNRVEEPVIVAKPAPAHGSPWWKDPIGDGLVGVGLIALGTGGYFLMSASSASSDAKASTNYFETERLNDKADSQGKKGVIASVVGGALILGGIVRYATRSGGNRETTTVSGWITPDSGGITALGRF
ncbi:MAG: hypothetical protein ABI867_27035, partial [Kofleriaceae bacterium]